MSISKITNSGVSNITLDSTNNRVGINQTVPAHPLHVGTDDLIVDASGNLLVGKSTSNYTTDGLEFRSDGQIFSSVGSDYTAYLNRKSTDGDILILAKDASTVGSIQTKDSRLFISGSQGSTPAGIYFGGGGDILPASTTNAVDNSISLGGTGHRWKDLYLSGGAYLGGTGSANYLDDYEEGTWTPRLRGGISEPGTLITGNGIYTKIGRLVTVTWDFSNVNTTGYSGTLSIDQLTFAPASSYMSGGNVMFNLMASFPTTTSNISCYLTSSSNSILFYGSENQAGWSALNHHAGTSARYSIGSLTYETT